VNDAQRTLAAEQLQELRGLAQTMTELAARWSGQAINNVLEVGSNVIPSTGTPGVEISWGAAAGSIEVDNQGTHPMTVQAAPIGASAPASGIGVYPVPANSRRTINLASHVVTVYGTAADVFAYQAFTCGARPVVI
jgi:hypothetical protein